MSGAYDVVIVGAGVSGGALAVALARQGWRVLLLEKTLKHLDRVRGEYLQPWGVLELKRLDLYERVMAEGANVISRSVGYDEVSPRDVAERRARSLGVILDGAPGCLGFGHPRLCDLLNAMAVEAGATVVRGIIDLAVTSGEPPEIAFTADGTRHVHRPALVIGADGRGSQVGRQAGIAMSQDPPHHFFTGLLVEDAAFWPGDTVTIGTEGDYVYFVVPQGGGRVRLYLGFEREAASRFAGGEGAQRFLSSFSFTALPEWARFGACRPIGPIHTYPNEDYWAETPVAPGVALVGDAAGYNDPLGGQGLSIALRDARIVSELLAQADRIDVGALAPYVEERRERMYRLRTAVAALARLRVEFGAERAERRRRVYARIAERPELGALFSSFVLGPERVAASAFTPAAVEELLA